MSPTRSTVSTNLIESSTQQLPTYKTLLTWGCHNVRESSPRLGSKASTSTRRKPSPSISTTSRIISRHSNLKLKSVRSNNESTLLTWIKSRSLNSSVNHSKKPFWSLSHSRSPYAMIKTLWRPSGSSLLKSTCSYAWSMTCSTTVSSKTTCCSSNRRHSNPWMSLISSWSSSQHRLISSRRRSVSSSQDLTLRARIKLSFWTRDGSRWSIKLWSCLRRCMVIRYI